MADWVGYDASKVTVTPTVDTAIYAANDCIGTLATLSATSVLNRRGGSGRIVKAVLTDKSSQILTHEVQAWIFDGNPTASTFTDQAAFAVHDDDIARVGWCISFSTAGGARHFFSANNAVAIVEMRAAYNCEIDNLYVVFKAIGTPTFTSASDLSLELIVERD